MKTTQYCLAAAQADDNGNRWWLRLTDYYPTAADADVARRDPTAYLHSWYSGGRVVSSDTPRLLDE